MNDYYMDELPTVIEKLSEYYFGSPDGASDEMSMEEFSGFFG